MNDDCFVLTNARLVLSDRVIEQGWLAVDRGLIVDLGEGTAPEHGPDMAGDTVIPGMIELHTDHLESHFAPRPHVRWHALSAVMAYDAQIASAGITTVFNSLRVGSDPDVDRGRQGPGHARRRAHCRPRNRSPARRASDPSSLRDRLARRHRTGGRLRRALSDRPDVADGPHAGSAPIPRSRDLAALLRARDIHEQSPRSTSSSASASTCTPATPTGIAARSSRSPGGPVRSSPATTMRPRITSTKPSNSASRSPNSRRPSKRPAPRTRPASR